MKILIILGLFAILLFSGCTNQDQTNQESSVTLASQETQEVVQFREVELDIEGLWCESCVYGIQLVMNTTQGIESAEVKITDYAAQTGIAKVIYNPNQITDTEIAKLTEPYPSKIVKDK